MRSLRIPRFHRPIYFAPLETVVAPRGFPYARFRAANGPVKLCSAVTSDNVMDNIIAESSCETGKEEDIWPVFQITAPVSTPLVIMLQLQDLVDIVHKSRNIKLPPLNGKFIP